MKANNKKNKHFYYRFTYKSSPSLMSGRLSLVNRGKSISSTTGQSSLICTEASLCFIGAWQNSEVIFQLP